MENGEDVPEWLKNGDYEFEYNITKVSQVNKYQLACL